MKRSGAARVWAAGLVTLQLVLLAALVLEPPGPWWPRNPVVLVIVASVIILGLFVASWGVLGLGPALTASPIPKERAGLITHGVYGIVRNPIYSGLIVIGAGLVVYGASWWHLATWVALVVLLSVKARWEERMLAAAHPEFAEYASRVGRFTPWFGRWHEPRSAGAGAGE